MCFFKACPTSLNRMRKSDAADLAAVLGSNAVADAPLEVGLRIVLDGDVNGPDLSSLVTTGSVLSHVILTSSR